MDIFDDEPEWCRAHLARHCPVCTPGPFDNVHDTDEIPILSDSHAAEEGTPVAPEDVIEISAPYSTSGPSAAPAAEIRDDNTARIAGFPEAAQLVEAMAKGATAAALGAMVDALLTLGVPRPTVAEALRGAKRELEGEDRTMRVRNVKPSAS